MCVSFRVVLQTYNGRKIAESRSAVYLSIGTDIAVASSRLGALANEQSRRASWHRSVVVSRLSSPMIRTPYRRTPLHACGGRITVSYEQVLDDLGMYGSLHPHSLHFSRRVDITIAYAWIYQCPSRRCLPDLTLTHREVADFHGQLHANQGLPNSPPFLVRGTCGYKLARTVTLDRRMPKATLGCLQFSRERNDSSVVHYTPFSWGFLHCCGFSHVE